MTDLVARRLAEHAGAGRLGRHVRHDPRSRAYAVQAMPVETLVSRQHHRHVPVFDQGGLGSCTGNACAGALSTGLWHHRFHEHTAVELYSEATQLDGDPDHYPPVDTGSDGLSVAKAAQRRGLISGYSHAFGLDALLTALQTVPVIAGITWLAGQDEPLEDGHARYTGAVRGGHEVCLDEIDVEQQRVWLCNSWGPDWGLAGRAWMTWAEWTRALADQGDVTVMQP